MYEGITMEELNIRSWDFQSALTDVVKTESKKSNMLPPSGMFSNWVRGPDNKRMKMQVVVTQVHYAEKRELFTANCKGATISILDLSQIAMAAAAVATGSTALPALSAISAIAKPTATISFSAQTRDVARSVSLQGRKNLLLMRCSRWYADKVDTGECWELQKIEHEFVKPPSAQVSPLDSMSS